jgi:2-desacetyl-2-hydroxyethyl bacteriochlorophyllide A dehydrogenase
MNQTTMQAVSWQGEDRVTVETVARPGSIPGRAIVDVAYVGICGTDLHICANEHPRAQPGIVIGHEIVGRLAEPVGDLPVGQPVFINPLLVCGACDACARGISHVCESLGLVGIDLPGGAAEQVSVDVESLVPLPSDLPLVEAALIEPLAVAVRAVRRSGMSIGDRVHVIGAGPIGLLTAIAARHAGAGTLTFSEPSQQRADVARSFGFAVNNVDPDRRADVVFDCTGHPTVAAVATRWVRTGGMLMVVGVYPGVVGVNLQEVLFRELDIRSVRVYTHLDIEIAARIISSRAVADLPNIVTSVLPLASGPEAIALLRGGHELKVLLKGPAA